MYGRHNDAVKADNPKDLLNYTLLQNLVSRVLSILESRAGRSKLAEPTMNEDLVEAVIYLLENIQVLKGEEIDADMRHRLNRIRMTLREDLEESTAIFLNDTVEAKKTM